MAAPIPALVKFLPHVALGLLFVAIALHWIGLDGPSQIAGDSAFFALALAVIFRREPL